MRVSNKESVQRIAYKRLGHGRGAMPNTPRRTKFGGALQRTFASVKIVTQNTMGENKKGYSGDWDNSTPHKSDILEDGCGQHLCRGAREPPNIAVACYVEISEVAKQKGFLRSLGRTEWWRSHHVWIVARKCSCDNRFALKSMLGWTSVSLITQSHFWHHDHFAHAQFR
jgi:hypothetical protein